MDKTSASVVTRTVTYYPAGGAMRINIVGGSNSVYYILKDHLGSASVVTNSSGVTVGEQRYYPYGETRITTGTIFTDKLFTGQRDTGLGIYDYNARYYSSKLGRFLSADTVGGLNRYQYANNNPLRYIDPSGHVACEGKNKDDGPQCVYFKNGGPKTLGDFKKLSWQRRRDWLDIFVEKNGLGNWFDDIKNAISGFMAQDPTMKNANGATNYMDAAVLQEINNGWNMHQHGSGAAMGGDMAVAGAAGWSNFFTDFERCVQAKCNQDTLISSRLKGEDGGVNLYAWPMTTQSGIYAQDSLRAQHDLSAFLDVANTYRFAGISCGAKCAGDPLRDPRVAGPLLAKIAINVEPAGGFELYYWWVVEPNTPIP